MGGYTNGRFPLSMMVKLGDKHYLPAGTAARWQWLVRTALEKYGVLLYITYGWNGYRPYDIQVEYRKELGIWAAVPGYSSHGLIYQGRLCAAIDVGNWQDLAPGNTALAWARFKALCRLAGFTVDFVSPQELWHIGDFNDIWTAPAFAAGNTTPATTPAQPEEEDEDMTRNILYKTTDDKYALRAAVTNDTSGLWLEFVDNSAGLMNTLANRYETGDAVPVSRSMFAAARNSATQLRPRAEISVTVGEPDA